MVTSSHGQIRWRPSNVTTTAAWPHQAARQVRMPADIDAGGVLWTGASPDQDDPFVILVIVGRLQVEHDSPGHAAWRDAQPDGNRSASAVDGCRLREALRCGALTHVVRRTSERLSGTQPDFRVVNHGDGGPRRGRSASFAHPALQEVQPTPPP